MVDTDKRPSSPVAACAEYLVVRPLANDCGSWSKACSKFVEIECPNVRCRWHDKDALKAERESVNCWELQMIQKAHDKFARHQAAEDERQRVRDAQDALRAEVEAAQKGS